MWDAITSLSDIHVPNAKVLILTIIIIANYEWNTLWRIISKQNRDMI